MKNVSPDTRNFAMPLLSIKVKLCRANPIIIRCNGSGFVYRIYFLSLLRRDVTQTLSTLSTHIK